MQPKQLLKHTVTTSVVSLIVVLIAWVWLSPARINKVPALTLTITDGSTLDLQQLSGRPVLVTFWATSCAPCVQEIPHLQALYAEFAEKGLEIIGIAMPYDPPNQVVRMMKAKQIDYPLAIDLEGKATSAFGGIWVTPTSFLIAPDGKVVDYSIGMMNLAKLRTIILSMLLQTS